MNVELRDLLAGLYLFPQQAVAVLRAVGLPPANVAFDPISKVTWTNILVYAEQNTAPGGPDYIRAIIVQAADDFPGNEPLKLALQGQLQPAHDAPQVDEDIPWKGGDWNEKIIGRNSLLPIAYLEKGLRCSRSVVRVVCSDGSSGSGFLIRGNHLVTNNHVLPTLASAQAARIQFNYQKDAAGRDLPFTEFALAPVADGNGYYTSPTDDWTAVKIDGDAESAWGALEFNETLLKVGAPVSIIQHPSGGAKQIAVNDNEVAYADASRVQYFTDTLPGSSGSPVFDSSWLVVALHHSGGWIREPGSKKVVFRNEGIAIGRVAADLRQAGILN